MTMHEPGSPGRLARLTRGLLIGTAALVVATALLHWSWNTALAEVFGAPTLEPRGALALALLAGLLRTVTWSHPRRHGPAGTGR